MTSNQIIAPIVEGQIRSFLHAHPAVADAVDWNHSHDTKSDALVASLAKRITTALSCSETMQRLRSAFAGEKTEGQGVSPSVAAGGEASTPPAAHSSSLIEQNYSVNTKGHIMLNARAVLDSLEGLREQYRDEGFQAMTYSGLGISPAAAVTQLLAAPELGERLAMLLNRRISMAGRSEHTERLAPPPAKNA